MGRVNLFEAPLLSRVTQYLCVSATWLQFGSHVYGVGMDYPTLVVLLPDGSINIYDAESQVIVQVIPPLAGEENRNAVIAAMGGWVPLQEQLGKLRKTKIQLRWEPEKVEDSA